MDRRHLPPVVRQLVEVVGEEAALALCEAFRTQRLWIPSSPGPDHPVTLLIGPELAARLGWWLSPGDYFDFPLMAAALRAARDADIFAACESATTADVTRQFGVSRRTLFRAKRRARGQDQPSEPAPPLPDLLSDL